MAVTVSYQGKEYSSKDKLGLARQLMVVGVDMEEAFKLANSTSGRKGVQNATTQFKADLALIKKGITALLMSVRSVASKKDTCRAEYMRKALKGLDEVNEGVFAGLTRKQKYDLLIKGCEAFGLAVATEIKSLELK